MLALLLLGPLAATAATRNVLVIYSNGRLLPANVVGDRGIMDGFESRPDLPISVAAEFFDRERFGGEAYERTFATYLRDKYATQPPDVIIVAGQESLPFLLRHRAELFPHVPIVYAAVESWLLRTLAPLPADVVGTPLTTDFVGTVEQALRWHRGTNRIVVVTGASEWDQQIGAAARTHLEPLASRLQIEFLSGLPLDELEQRLRHLPAGTVVVTPGFFRDGAGRQMVPVEAARLVAAASSAPVYGSYSPFIGSGVVGGRMASFEAMGREAALTAIALLEGIPPAQLNLPATAATTLEVDWRQLQRWGIPSRAVPDDAIVHFREPSLWEAHRELVITGVLVMLLQAGLIAALLFERRRRRRTVSALVRSEEQMRIAAQAASLSTWVLDYEAADPTRKARAAKRVDVPTGPQVDFRDVLARVLPTDRAAVNAALREAQDTNGEFEVEYRIELPDGDVRWYAARGRADQTRMPRLVGVAIDITQRKRAEIQAGQDRAAMYHMTRVSLLGQLSASIAHQLNQPLASIMGNAEAAQKMLEREPLDLPELRSICEDIVAEDRRAAQVIRRLGALFKRGEPSFEPLVLNELVHDTIELTRNVLLTRHVNVVMDLAPDLPSIQGDRVQLQQLLLNLVVNASDAMLDLPEHTRVLTIETSMRSNAVALCVRDRGPGIAEDNKTKVFDPFWTTKPGGMGMGLAICRSIAEAHHGSLVVGDAAGGGAEFCLVLQAGAAP